MAECSRHSGESLRSPRRKSRKRKRKFDTVEPEPVIKKQRHSTASSSDEFAIDCEMTQIRRGPGNNTEQVLSSVAIVDSSMNLVYHAICPPPGWNTGYNYMHVYTRYRCRCIS